MSALPSAPATELEKKIKEYLEYLEVEKGCSPLTIRNYYHYLSRFSTWLKDTHKGDDLSALSPQNVRSFRLYLSRLPGTNGEGVMSRKTQSYHAIAIRSLLRFLVKNDYDVMSPDKIELPKITERQVKFLSHDQVARLLNAPSIGTLAGKRDKAILEVLYSTGLRVSELVKLNRDKIDIDRREFGVVGKGGKARVVFLSQGACEWIANYLKARTDHFEPLFIRHRGKIDPTTKDDDMRLTTRSIQRLLKKYVAKIKLSVDATPHVLRHSFATDLLMAGADLRSVQEMLGHKNVQTTQIYTHVTHRHLRDIHAAFHGKGGS